MNFLNFENTYLNFFSNSANLENIKNNVQKDTCYFFIAVLSEQNRLIMFLRRNLMDNRLNRFEIDIEIVYEKGIISF